MPTVFQEIRLELDDAKLNGILMELDILHRAVAPEIVEFYGAFFIESYVGDIPIPVGCAKLVVSAIKMCLLLHGVHGRWVTRQATR